ncbi:serine/threonine-protein kinase 12 isoform X2 [Coffea arabica]|uniref:Serine/threonine-protein kinase 12 isoform X2 n=1 Tax=Coffea arabica TaxID=13443 RepID=A0ABM4WFQ4_COFAR
MEAKTSVRFTLGRQSSLASERWSDELEREGDDDEEDYEEEEWNGEDIDPGVRLMYAANEGDLDGIKELLDSGVDVNFRDIDDRTALHVAACQGFSNVVKLLIENEAQVDPKDRWGSTPLSDAIHYKNHDVVKLLEKHGAKPLGTTFKVASWRGTKVGVKKFGEEVISDEDKVRAFRDELALLQKLRHPNLVQFLGAVTQSSPMMIVTEYLPKGDLRSLLEKKRALKPAIALRYALDIARGMNYLHETRPEAIIHRHLEPSNILRDDSGHLKVADFGVTKLLKVAKRVKEDRPLSYHEVSCRYEAPEVFRDEEYDTKVDVFSFALILQEMIEGCPPFYTKKAGEVPDLYAAKQRPPFKAPTKFYAHGIKELIEECWSQIPADRPTFEQIIHKLEIIYNKFGHRSRWKVRPLKCFQRVEAMWKKDLDPSSRSTSSI